MAEDIVRELASAGVLVATVAAMGRKALALAPVSDLLRRGSLQEVSAHRKLVSSRTGL